MDAQRSEAVPLYTFSISRSDIEKIRAGIGEQVSHFLSLMVGFVICVTLSFVYGWKLTLVVIGYVPIIVVTNMIISRVGSHFQLLVQFAWK